MSLENTQVEEHGADGGAVHTGHPTPATYFKVAMILSALTAVEVAIFYITPLSYGIIPHPGGTVNRQVRPGSPVLHAPEVRLEGVLGDVLLWNVRRDRRHFRTYGPIQLVPDLSKRLWWVC